MHLNHIVVLIPSASVIHEGVLSMRTMNNDSVGNDHAIYRNICMYNYIHTQGIPYLILSLDIDEYGENA
jgi:hypothetical protein